MTEKLAECVTNPVRMGANMKGAFVLQATQYLLADVPKLHEPGHDSVITQSASRNVHNLSQSEFSTEGNLVLPPLIYSILSFL